MNVLTKKSLHSRIVSGSVVLLSGSGLTTAINLTYNILVARSLGPKGFGHATVVYTILTLISAVTLAFQIVSTKVVAQQDDLARKSAVYRLFHRGAWGCGILIALILLIFQKGISNYLNLPDSMMVALLSVGAAFYIPLGTRRGYIQGTLGFRRLATNLVLEGIVRLVGSFLAIRFGYDVNGVIAANSLAVAIAYLAIRPKSTPRVPNPLTVGHALRETCQALVFFSGQVLINNCDIVLVKHFFASREAGLYAAVAMVGRVIFAFSNSVVNSMFPLVAGTDAEERKDFKVIATSLALVLGSGSMLALGLAIAPSSVWTHFFGSGFEIAGKYNLPYLLALYAVTTVIYSLSVVIITFEMSYKIANTSYVQLACSGAMIIALCIFHGSLRQVILVQLVLMLGLFVFVAFPFLADSLSNPKQLLSGGACRPVRLLRRVSEDEVIAEFLKSDFYYPAFREYQESLRAIVVNPNFADPIENEKRRALFHIRQLSLWKELPTDTEWYEVEVNVDEIEHVRVFPRAQWRKLARGNFSIPEIVESLRSRRHLVDTTFLSKIDAIKDRLTREEASVGAVVLIGLNEHEPLTVLDGNHRFVSAMLASPTRLDRCRFLCGLSPRMAECCWYNTNFLTLFRYGKNVMTHVLRNPEAELARLLESTS